MYYTLDYLESKIREAKSDREEGVELDVYPNSTEIADMFADLVEEMDHYDKTLVFESLVASGFEVEANENPAFDAIATLRHKLTTLALYPDMTALDVLDYIEEAIK